jgi:hypothetical protein
MCFMPPSKSSELRAAGDALVAILHRQRELGPGAYPLALQKLLDLADTLLPELKARAAGHKSFLERVALSRKKDPQAPVALREDLDGLAGSDLLLEYILSAVTTAKQWKWPVARLAGKLDKELQPAFKEALTRRLEQDRLPAGIGMITVRGQANLYRVEMLPESAQALLLADRLVRQLRELRGQDANCYPPTLDRLASLLEEAPVMSQLTQALKEAPFKENALLAVPKNLASPVALKEDAGALAESTRLLEFLLHGTFHEDHRAAPVAELKKRLDKSLQRQFENGLQAQIGRGSLPPGIGWLPIKKAAHLFFLRDVSGGGHLSEVSETSEVYRGMASAPLSISRDEFERAFAEAFDRLDAREASHNFVSLLDLRRAVLCARDLFDSELQRLRRQGKYALSAVEGRHGIRPEEADAAVPEEGSLLLYVSRRTGG